MSIRVCIVGLGKVGANKDRVPGQAIADSHAGAVSLTEGVEIYIGVDTDQESRDIFGTQWGIPTETSLETALEKYQPQILCIATASDTHARLCEAALNANIKAIVCEKPFVRTRSEGESLLKKVDSLDSAIFVNHWMRWSPEWEHAAAFLSKSPLGKILSCRYTYSKGVFNSGTHAFDILRLLFGEIIEVRATSGYELDTGERNIDGWLISEGGVQIELRTCDYREQFIASCEIQCEKGRLVLGDEFLLESETEAYSPTDVFGATNKKEPPFVRLYSEVRDFVTGESTLIRCSALDGFKATRTAIALEESLSGEGSTVRLEE